MSSVAARATCCLRPFRRIVGSSWYGLSRGQRDRHAYFHGKIVILREKTCLSVFGDLIVDFWFSADFSGTFEKIHNRPREMCPANNLIGCSSRVSSGHLLEEIFQLLSMAVGRKLSA